MNIYVWKNHDKLCKITWSNKKFSVKKQETNLTNERTKERRESHQIILVLVVPFSFIPSLAERNEL
jgi:hypothetical protein